MTAAAPTVPRSRRRWLGTLERRNLRWGLFFISPWLIGFFVFSIFPILYTFFLSLTRYSGIRPPILIGLTNYERLATDPLFWKSAYNTLFYTALAVPVGVVVALILALAMNQKLVEIGFYRAALYLPAILPVFAISLIFIYLLNPAYGMVNALLEMLGLPSPNWLGDPTFARISLVMIAQLGAGQWALVFLAGMRGIPIELYESADIDGAGFWTKFRRITLPLMTPVILYDIIIGLSLGLQVFTSAFILTGGGGGRGGGAGPDNALLTFVYYLYKQAFQFGQMGYAATLSVVLFVVSLILAAAVFRWARGWVFYQAEEA
jgi:multiple sugar transport system permease protein